MNSTTLRPQYVIKADDSVYRRIHLGVNANIEQNFQKKIDTRTLNLLLLTNWAF